MMTEQEIFDTVARHLLTQGKKSIGVEGGCAYRGKEGCKCAAGCLIPDDLYDPRFENLAWGTGVAQAASPLAKFLDLCATIGHTDLVRNLQIMHDNLPPCDWLYTLLVVAKNCKLSAAILDEFPNWVPKE